MYYDFKSAEKSLEKEFDRNIVVNKYLNEIGDNKIRYV